MDEQPPLPPLPPTPCEDTTPPPPLPVDNGEIEDGEISSPMSCQLSPRGIKRADIDDDDGAPPSKQQCIAADEEKAGIFMGMSENVDLHVIDDIGDSEGEEEEDGENKDDGGEDEDSDWMDVEEVDQLLDDGVKDYKEKKEEMARPIEKEKIVLVERCQELFDVLPEGWVMFTHDSGMPIYLHKPSRVVTHSRPYFLGPGSARKHDIPLSAIPCMQYRRAVNKEKEQAEAKKAAEQVSSSTDASNAPDSSSTENVAVRAEPGCSGEEQSSMQNGEAAGKCPFSRGEGLDLAKEAASTVIATAEEYRKENSLSAVDLREYCESLFQFRSITVKRFKTWKDKRKHYNQQKLANRPTLPSTTKLISRPVPCEIGGERVIRKVKDVVLNPVGKTDVCVLHEYLQHAHKMQPKFIFAEMESSSTPYSCTVIINGIKYGTGYGSSKKVAKNESAAQTLDIMLPELKEKMRDESPKAEEQNDLSFFDEIRIDDPRVTELCNKAGQPNPYTILTECTKRNHGMCDMKITTEMKTPKHQKSEFIMRVGKHEATVVVKNKREGKQQAAQKILQLLHPHVNCWGSLLRLYGSANAQLKEKKEDEKTEEAAKDDNENSPPVMSLRRSARPRGKSGKAGAKIGKRTPTATTVGRALRTRAANQKSPAATVSPSILQQKSPSSKRPCIWQLSDEDESTVVEFVLMEYGALGDFAEEDCIVVPHIAACPVKRETSTEKEKEETCRMEDVKVKKEDDIKTENAVEKKERCDVGTQVEEEEKKDVPVKVLSEQREQEVQVHVTQQDATTVTHTAAMVNTHVQAGVKSSNAEVQACVATVNADVGSDRSYAATKDAGNITINQHIVRKDVGTSADLSMRGYRRGTDQGAQTVLKGWQSASLDVSVQQSNGSFRVQSLDVSLDYDTVNRPLRIWFPPSGVDALCQTDIKGWVDTHMDVITQGEDGSYYLKKSQEHGVLDTDLVYRPYRVHRATQATWVGSQTFHMATQTKWDGSSTFHKATQFPDPQKNEEQMGQSVLYTLDKGCPVGLTPTLNPFTSAPTVTSLLATLGLPSTEDAPLLPLVQTPIMSTTSCPMSFPADVSTNTSTTATSSSSNIGVQPMDIDAEGSPSPAIVVSQSARAGDPAPVTSLAAETLVMMSSFPSSSVPSSAAVTAIAGSEGERIITPTSYGINAPVMSFAGYNQFTPAPGAFNPLLGPAGGAYPMQPLTYFPQYPGLPTGYNFFPGWM